MEKSLDLYRVTEVELVYKYIVKPADRAVIGSAADAYKLLLSCWDEHKMELQEQFKVLLLNNSSHVLGLYHVSSGGMTGTVVDARLIYAAALKAGASAMILAHNHPSGKLSPSSQDKSITPKLRDGGKLLDIRVLDHLIITPYDYYSFANEGLM